jgi:hypothetical protein
MRTIIAGSRTIKDLQEVRNAIDACPWEITTCISGCAKGVDTLALVWAGETDTPVEFFPANFEKFGTSAPHIRNQEMVNNAEALLAIWDGGSHGTAHVITLARKAGLALHIHQVGTPPPKPQQEFAL